MGRKGDALRAQRKLNARYQVGGVEISGAALADNNKRLIQEYTERVRQTAIEEAHKQIEEREKAIWAKVNEEWDRRNELFNSGDMQNNLMEFTTLTVMITVKILHEKFGWRAVPEGRKRDGRYKFVRFHDYFATELNAISENELIDIRRYSEKVAKAVGIDFKVEVEE